MRIRSTRTWGDETWGLVGYGDGRKTVLPTSAACHDTGWRPPDVVWMTQDGAGSPVEMVVGTLDSAAAEAATG